MGNKCGDCKYWLKWEKCHKDKTFGECKKMWLGKIEAEEIWFDEHTHCFKRRKENNGTERN